MMTTPSRMSSHRATLLAMLIAAPAVINALTIGALEGWRSYQPDSPLFAAPRVSSLADAIARDDVQQAYEFIKGGQDPNGLIEVADPVLTGGRRVSVSPMLWAVAMRSDRSVLTLFGVGARIDADAARRAVCLAERLGQSDIARLLERHSGHVSSRPCQDIGDAALLDTAGRE